MGKLARLAQLVPAPVKAFLGVASAWVAIPALVDRYPHAVWPLYRAAYTAGWFGGMRSSVIRDAIHDSYDLVYVMGRGTLLGLTFAVSVAMLVRMIARARVRAGLADPLDRLRAWTAARAVGARRLLALPAIAWVVAEAGLAARFVRYWGGWSMYGSLAGTATIQELHRLFAWLLGSFAVALLVPALGIYAATRVGARAFLAPTLAGDDADPVPSERRIGFDAVAVTAETRAAVAGMAVLPFLVVNYLITAKALTDATVAAALATYVAVAIGATLAFRRASRIAVGSDGVFVTGSSRSRFFAYRDVDAVRARGADIELVRKGRVILRLQLHGKDAAHKEAIVQRIDEAVRAAREQSTATVAAIVAAVPEAKLARLADGGEGYRSPSVTRSQLWSVVEGPEHDALTREAAAKALVASGDGGERERLRVAAGQCAQPRVRIALMDLSEEEEGDAGLTKERRAGRRSSS
jgi:hypothetical protein